MLRRDWMILPRLVCLVLLTVISGAPAAAQNAGAPHSEPPGDIAPYLNPQQQVRIAGGRTINLVCLGQGSPTVILTAGAGGWSQVWNRIQGPLSHTNRVCAWDPAGLGFSSPGPDPQDAVHKTEDLEEALQGAHVDGPYVMVGHSAGAFVALLFTDQHRATVAGMVLVDPSIPDETAVRERVAPEFAAFGDRSPRGAAERLRQCAARLQSGELKSGMPGFDECTAQPMPPEFSSLSERLARLNADPARLLTQASAIANGPLSGREVINPQRRYGDMPLIVLTSGQRPMPPDIPADVREQAAKYFRALESGHDAYAALSTRGHHQLVRDSGHFIQFDDPQAVIAAINRVLAEIGFRRPAGLRAGPQQTERACGNSGLDKDNPHPTRQSRG